MGRYAFVGKDGVGGGLNVSDSAIMVPPSQVVESRNVLQGQSIARRKRGGQAAFYTGVTSIGLTASTPIRGGIEFWFDNAGTQASKLVLLQGTKIWSVAGRTSSAVNRTGALTIATDGVPDFQPFENKLFLTTTNTADGYLKWDGAAASFSAATDPADGPGKYICEHFGRMWMTGNSDFRFRVYYSKAFDAETWTTVGGGGSLDLANDGDPQGITGICPFQGRLYVWTRRSLWEITGNDPTTFVITLVSKGIGCISNASIVPIPNDVLWCSDRGLHSLRQIESGKQTTVEFLSRDIQKLFTSLLNRSLADRIAATYVEDENLYLLTVPSAGQTTNDQILAFNTVFGTWNIWPDMGARSVMQYIVSNKQEILLGKESGALDFINQTARDDLGDGYTMYFKTGVIYASGDPTVERKYNSVTVLVATTQPSTFSVGWSVDGKQSSSKVFDLTAGNDLLGTTFTLGRSRLGVGQYLPITVSIDQVGYGIQLEVSCPGTGDLEFYGFILECEEANENYT